MKNRKMKSVNINLTRAQWAALKCRATLKNLKMSELILRRIHKDLGEPMTEIVAKGGSEM